MQLLNNHTLSRILKPCIALVLLVVTFGPLYGAIPQAKALAIEPTAGDVLPNGQPAPSAAARIAADSPATTAAANAALPPDSQQQGTNTGQEVNLSTACSNASTCISSIVYIFTVWPMSVFAYIGAYIFDFSLQITLRSAAYSQEFLTTGWAAVRDIANMAFVFILIYIAFTIILKAEESGTMKKLAMVVVMALLINFSFFVTRVVIDAGNILAIQFYSSIQAPNLTATAAQTSLSLAGVSALASANTNTKDLTANIMNLLGVQTLLGNTSFQQFTNGNGFLTNVATQITIYICVAAILAVMAFLFMVVGFKFLMRIAVLWLVIISAPLAFAANAVSGSPAVSAYFGKWRDLLVRFSMYPAVFLFLFLIVNNIVVSMAQSGSVLGSVFGTLVSTGTSGQGGVVAITGAIAAIVLRLGFIVILLYGTMAISEKFAAEGGAAAKGASNWVSKQVGGATFGAMGWAGRATVGKASLIAARSQAVNTFAASSPLGMFAKRGLEGVAKRSFDVRGISAVKKGAAATGMSLGDAYAGGYEKWHNDRAHEVEAQAKLLKMDDWTKGKTAESYVEDQKPILQAQKAAAEQATTTAAQTAAAAKTTHTESQTALKEAERAVTEAKAARNTKIIDLARDAKIDEMQKDLDNKKAAAAAAEKAMAAAETALKEKEAAAAKVAKSLTKEELTKAAKAYVSGIEKERLHKLAARMEGRNIWNLGLPSRGSRIGAHHIHDSTKEKSAEQKALDVLKNAIKKEEAAHTPTPAAAHAPTPAAAAPAKSAPAKPAHDDPGHDTHGGGHH